jgi:hypothetical protein
MSATFQTELDRWGPEAAGTRPVTPAEAEAYCRNLARSHYENFPIVSWLLPRRLHQHFYNLYAYCRWADDLGDEVGDPARSLELLAWWRRELDACRNGTATHPVFVGWHGRLRNSRFRASRSSISSRLSSRTST